MKTWKCGKGLVLSNYRFFRELKIFSVNIRRYSRHLLNCDLRIECFVSILILRSNQQNEKAFIFFVYSSDIYLSFLLLYRSEHNKQDWNVLSIIYLFQVIELMQSNVLKACIGLHYVKNFCLRCNISSTCLIFFGKQYIPFLHVKLHISSDLIHYSVKKVFIINAKMIPPLQELPYAYYSELEKKNTVTLRKTRMNFIYFRYMYLGCYPIFNQFDQLKHEKIKLV